MVISYMTLVVSMYILLFQNLSKIQFQDHNAVQDCSFKEFLSLKFKILFFGGVPKYFYETTICYIIVFTSYNNPVLYKLSTFIKKQYFMV